jgi:hypothetical protein
MTISLSNQQALLLWRLLGRGGEALQSEFRPKIEKADREALVGSGMVASARRGRSFNLVVTDRGWRWAQDHLDHPLPPNYRVLQDWLIKLGIFLQKTETTLAALFTENEVTPTPNDARAAIERAYLKVTNGQKSRSVSLAKIRAALPEFDRATVDEALLEILREGKKATLVRVADKKTLTSADRAAVFKPGSEEFHHIWIDP